ncbi:MAG: hypothetical protein KBS62_00970 [Oscillospiraceae bacterium]|nr:hypothetical protein [Candidatus Ruminococcus equi]
MANEINIYRRSSSYCDATLDRYDGRNTNDLMLTVGVGEKFYEYRGSCQSGCCGNLFYEQPRAYKKLALEMIPLRWLWQYGSVTLKMWECVVVEDEDGKLRIDRKPIKGCRVNGRYNGPYTTDALKPVKHKGWDGEVYYEFE